MTDQTKTVAVRMAKADKDDFKTVYAIYGHLQVLEQSFDCPLDVWGDTERRHLAAMAAHHQRNAGAISRLIGCCDTLMSDQNALIDPAQDVLDFHPRIKKALKLLDMVETESAFNFLKPVMIGEQALKSNHLCYQCDDFHIPDENCELCGGEGEYQEMHVIDWTTQKQTLSMAFVAMLKQAGTDE
ncbi:TPA: hypothetical protein P0E30_003743 [Vibrio harveyi]|nr:hypothetical protein [Vibrio harveyi]